MIDLVFNLHCRIRTLLSTDDARRVFQFRGRSWIESDAGYLICKTRERLIMAVLLAIEHISSHERQRQWKLESTFPDCHVNGLSANEKWCIRSITDVLLTGRSC